MARAVMHKLRAKKPKLFYLTLEVDKERLKASMEEMGWFEGGNKDAFGRHGNKVRFIEVKPEIDRPVPNSEEMGNMLFRKLEAHVEPGSEEPVLVLVDSLTAMVSSSGDFAERRRQTNELLFRLRSLFGECLMLTLLIAERSSTPPEDPASAVEEYLADFVFRLDLRHLELGRRLRTLDIIKTHGANMTVGQHTWMILTDRGETSKAVSLTQTLNTKIRDKAFDEKGIPINNEKWGAILILPRSRAHTTFSDGEKVGGKQILHAGTPGLDQMLTGEEPEYWLDLVRSSSGNTAKPGLEAGSITLLVGPPGSGKTGICNQFLKVDDLSIFMTGDDPPKKVPNLFITFEREHLTEKSEEYKSLVFRHSQVDFNLLLTQVREEILKGLPRRIAIDGLSEWLSAYQSKDRAMVLEAFLAGIDEATQEIAKKYSNPIKPTLFISYETSLQGDPLAPDTLGIPADNIIVLRQIQVQDATRRLLYIVKGSAQYDRNIRELVYRKDQDSIENKACVTAGLDAFSSLLSRNPQKAEVLLQMFEENKAEAKWNSQMVKRLKKSIPLTYNSFTFFRTEIGSTLLSCNHSNTLPSSDLRIMSVDEWWLRHVLAKHDPNTKNHLLLDLSGLLNPAHQNSRLNWNDFWLTEVDKCKVGENQKISVLAVPAYMDFGMFCVNAQQLIKVNDDKFKTTLEPLIEKIPSKPENRKDPPINPAVLASAQQALLKAIEQELPKTWVPKNFNFDSFPIVPSNDESKSLLEIAKPKGEEDAPWFFAFDTSTPETCVCQFFELAWAFGASEDFLAHKMPKTNNNPLTQSLRLLQYMVHHRLMPPGANVRDTANAVFSRQFLSTLANLKRDEQIVDAIVPLQYWPSGSNDDEAHAALIEDLRKRLERQIVDRLNTGLLSLQKVPKLEKQASELYNKLNEQPSLIPSIKPEDTLGKIQAFTKKLRKSPEPTLYQSLQTFLKNAEFTIENLESKINKPVITVEDFTELFQRHELRLDLLSKESPTLTGYGCTGAWFYAVHAGSRSVTLAPDILQEMTSLKSAIERAELGAGMPARKDFYDHMGHHPVKHAEHFTWSELYDHAGARARRRDRVLPTNCENAPEIYRYISSMVVRTLHAAQEDTHRGKSRVAIPDAASLAKLASHRANTEVEALYEYIFPKKQSTPP